MSSGQGQGESCISGEMPFQSFLQDFLHHVDRRGGKPCYLYRENGAWRSISWSEAGDQVSEIALGLKELGLKKGDRVAIFSGNRMEWTLCDLAVLSLGGVTVPIYHSSPADQAVFVLKDSEARFVFVGNRSFYEKIREVGPPLEKIILISETGDRGTLTLDRLREQGRPPRADRKAWRRLVEEIKPTDTATLVYTSGTTGPPKGAVLTHENFVAEIDALTHLFDLNERSLSILFLPLAHIVARAMQFFQVRIGFPNAYSEITESLVDEIRQLRPDFFVAVPRLFEKIYEKIQQRVETGPVLKKTIFAWALSVGMEVHRRRREKKGVSLSLLLKEVLADRLVFKKLREVFGGRIRFLVCGGAPLSQSIAEFFDAVGILILEGYGLTETSAAITCNAEANHRFGTVGRPVRGAELKINPDGEILARGPMVFKGYFQNAEATSEALASDGWFKTGDIGEIDPEGFLKITDRKKDIIVTAGGKNVAPQNIENLLKTVPYISQVVVHGDRRKYLTALVTLNQEPVERYARKEGIRYSDFKDLVRHPKVYGLIQKAIEEKSKNLGSYETIKKFAILENNFTQEAGEITPTLKVRRKIINQKYKDVLDQLYQ